MKTKMLGNNALIFATICILGANTFASEWTAKNKLLLPDLCKEDFVKNTIDYTRNEFRSEMSASQELAKQAGVYHASANVSSVKALNLAFNMINSFDVIMEKAVKSPPNTISEAVINYGIMLPIFYVSALVVLPVVYVCEEIENSQDIENNMFDISLPKSAGQIAAKHFLEPMFNSTHHLNNSKQFDEIVDYLDSYTGEKLYQTVGTKAELEHEIFKALIEINKVSTIESFILAVSGKLRSSFVYNQKKANKFFIGEDAVIARTALRFMQKVTLKRSEFARARADRLKRLEHYLVLQYNCSGL